MTLSIFTSYENARNIRECFKLRASTILTQVFESVNQFRSNSCIAELQQYILTQVFESVNQLRSEFLHRRTYSSTILTQVFESVNQLRSEFLHRRPTAVTQVFESNFDFVYKATTACIFRQARTDGKRGACTITSKNAPHRELLPRSLPSPSLTRTDETFWKASWQRILGRLRALSLGHLGQPWSCERKGRRGTIKIRRRLLGHSATPGLLSSLLDATLPLAMSVLLLALALLGAVHADKMFSPPAPPPAPGYSYGRPDLRADASTLDQQEQDPIAALAANIPGGGVPGEDYPILASVPDTGFSCEEQQFPGYYADTAPEAGCQVFHICQFDGRQDAFLCPNGTLFNQQYFVCDWWFNVDCAASEQFRSLNADIGKIPEDAAASVRDDVVAPDQLYGTPEARQAPPPTPSQSYGSPNRF
nr:uncharacterized protein LOC113804289 [Penaeus vannamei]